MRFQSLILAIRGLLYVSLPGLIAGCALNPMSGFLDPTKVGQFPPEYKEGGIRRVLTPRESPFGLANSTEPTAEDTVVQFEEYRLGPTDQLAMQIDDFIQGGVPFTLGQEVNSAGYIRIPQLGFVKVTGMTDDELEEDLRTRIKQAKILPNPIVQVQITLKRQQTFSILGSIRTAGTFPLPNTDLRLLEAIGLAGDMGAGVRKLYVIRRSERMNEPGRPQNGAAPPPATGTAPRRDLVVPPPDENENFRGTSLSTDGSFATRQDAQRRELEAVLTPAGKQPTAQSTQPGGQPFAPLVFDPATGELKESPALPSGTAPAGTAPFEEAPSDRAFRWEDEPEIEQSQRVIEIDVNGLKGGDPKQNIIVRSRDTIVIPIDVGIFYIMGEVNRPGAFPFNEREITLKQAVAMMGGFSALAWPSRCEIIRREKGTDKQITIPVNIDSIFAGMEDDILLKDDDIVNVGSNIITPFLFVIRNSFRFTYGFGFVYDRNFADQDSYNSRINPESAAQARRQLRGLPF